MQALDLRQQQLDQQCEDLESMKKTYERETAAAQKKRDAAVKEEEDLVKQVKQKQADFLKLKEGMDAEKEKLK